MLFLRAMRGLGCAAAPALPLVLARNVERMLKSHMGKPHSQEKALERFISGLSPDDVTHLRRHIYQKQGT